MVISLNLILNIGLHILSRFASLGAIYDSSEHFPPPKCHPDTLHEAIRAVMRWIEDDDPGSPVFWIYGPAGASKPAIAQTLAELIQAFGRSYGVPSFPEERLGATKHTAYLQPLPTNSHQTRIPQHKLPRTSQPNPLRKPHLADKAHPHSDASSHRRTTGEIK